MPLVHMRSLKKGYYTLYFLINNSYSDWPNHSTHSNSGTGSLSTKAADMIARNHECLREVSRLGLSALHVYDLALVAGHSKTDARR